MSASRRLQQIDLLKGAAAIAVVATHSMTVEQKTASWAVLHIWQAVPVFVVLIGVTSGLSFSRYSGNRLSSVLNRRYVVSRTQRIVLPFLVIWVLALAVGIRAGSVSMGPLTLVGQLPHPGPGNYFVPLVVTLALIAPLVWWGWQRSPWLTLGALFAVDLSFELVATRVPLFTQSPLLYSAAFPRYLAALGLGFLIVDTRIPSAKKHVLLFGGAALSLGYLVVGNLGAWSPPFLATWRTQNMLAVFYPATIVALGILLLPSSTSSRPYSYLARVGRASYHVFLVQMLYFMVVPQGRALLMPINVVLCVVGGFVFAGIDSKYMQRKISPREPGVVAVEHTEMALAQPARQPDRGDREVDSAPTH